MTNTSITETPFAHVEFRPMHDFDDHCLISSLEEAEYFGVYSAPSGEPVSRDEIFETASDALSYMFSSPQYHTSRKWYNGHEIMFEFSDLESLYNELSEYFEDVEEDYKGHLELRKLFGLAGSTTTKQGAQAVQVHQYPVADHSAHRADPLAAIDADRTNVFLKVAEIMKLEERARLEPFKWHTEWIFDELHHCMDTSSHVAHIQLTSTKLTAYYDMHGDVPQRVYIDNCEDIEEAKTSLLEAISL